MMIGSVVETTVSCASAGETTNPASRARAARGGNRGDTGMAWLLLGRVRRSGVSRGFLRARNRFVTGRRGRARRPGYGHPAAYFCRKHVKSWTFSTGGVVLASQLA